jgi:hypothetical protein
MSVTFEVHKQVTSPKVEMTETKEALSTTVYSFPETVWVYPISAPAHLIVTPLLSRVIELFS